MHATLDIYTDYLICQNNQATATGLADLLCGEMSHDKFTRFLNGTALGSQDLWLYIKPEVRTRLHYLAQSFNQYHGVSYHNVIFC